MKSSLTERRYVVPFVLITSLFFLWGFARAILDVLNKHFQTELNISITQSSLVQVTTYLGYFLMAIPAGLLINKVGYKRGVVTGLLLYAIGAFLFVPGTWANSFSGYLVALFVIACGLVFLETAANPYATELGPKETASSRLNLSQSFNGMGSALAPIVVGGLLFSGSGADDPEILTHYELYILLAHPVVDLIDTALRGEYEVEARLRGVRASDRGDLLYGFPDRPQIVLSEGIGDKYIAPPACMAFIRLSYEDLSGHGISQSFEKLFSAPLKRPFRNI